MTIILTLEELEAELAPFLKGVKLKYKQSNSVKIRHPLVTMTATLAAWEGYIRVDIDNIKAFGRIPANRLLRKIIRKKMIKAINQKVPFMEAWDAQGDVIIGTPLKKSKVRVKDAGIRYNPNLVFGSGGIITLEI